MLCLLCLLFAIPATPPSLSACQLSRRQIQDQQRVCCCDLSMTSQCILLCPPGCAAVGIVKELSQPLTCLAECYVICTKVCVCVCPWLTFRFCTSLFYMISKPCGFMCHLKEAQQANCKVRSHVQIINVCARVCMCQCPYVSCACRPFTPQELFGSCSGYVFATITLMELSV